jgi:hypothetical protein
LAGTRWLALALACAGILGLAGPARAVPVLDGCPTAADPAAFESADRLLADNQVQQGIGMRPTASPNQLRYIGWLERQLRALPGMQVGGVDYTVDRWLAKDQGLEVGSSARGLRRLSVSGPVPYAKAGAATGPLVYVPQGTAISARDVAGKIVVRDAAPGSVPNAAFAALEWGTWDPDLSLTKDIASNYERDYLGYEPRITDLEEAAAGHAAGLVFVHGFPAAQVRDQYAPYEGTRWKVPALYVGVDEGQKLLAQAQSGGVARLRLSASEGPAPTRTIVATLPGTSDERIVVESHTDGMNAIWDNGPIAILALARHFAALPLACRPRTLQFVLTTGHLYQHLLGGADRGGGAEQEAKELDADYDKGTVAMAFALEHLGAHEYAAQPRPGGLPGRELVPTGQTEPTGIFVGPSPVLVNTVQREVVANDLRRTIILRGADLPGAHIPIHESFGGEGGAYEQHLVPTIALVTGPWTLYNPAFGMEAIDGDLLRRQSLVFADLIHDAAVLPREVLGGGYVGERAARSALCASAFAGMGFVRCGDDAYG